MVSPWLLERGATRRPRARLVCIPYAGGGTAVFQPWMGLLPDDLEVALVRLPGRESRFREPPITEVDEVVDRLAELMTERRDLPLAIFGYSLGALLGYELALRLQSIGPVPRLLLVGGAEPPHLPRSRPPLGGLTDTDFLAALRELDGTPAEVFEHPELLALLLPMLRADFRLLEAYQPRRNALLGMPIITYSGAEDRELSAAGVARWSDLTTGATRHRSFAGGHFFWTGDRTGDRTRELVNAVLDDLHELGGN